MTRAAVVALLLLVAVAMAAAAQHGHGGGPVHPVSIPEGRLVFEPADLTVPPGSTVRWTSDGGVPHTATATLSPDDPAPSGQFRGRFDAAGDTYEVFLTAAGEFHYYCEIHLGPMRGVIRVVEGASHGDHEAVHEDNGSDPDIGGEGRSPTGAPGALLAGAAVAAAARLLSRSRRP